MLLLAITALALGLGFVLPMRWGVWGFLGALLMLFALQAGASKSTGFAGSNIAESLLLFNGSFISYLGFNLQITYRAFALPLLALGAVMVWRFARKQV